MWRAAESSEHVFETSSIIIFLNYYKYDTYN